MNNISYFPVDGVFTWECQFEEAETLLVDGKVTWCDMEQGHNGTDDQIDWLSGEGQTPSEPTGPRSAFKDTGYIFMEASGHKNNDKAK